MLGDICSCSSSEDLDTKDWVGKTCSYLFLIEKLPVIADEYVDR